MSLVTQDYQLIFYGYVNSRQYVDLIDLTIDYGKDTDVDDLPPPVFSHTQRFELYEYPPVVKNTSVF